MLNWLKNRQQGPIRAYSEGHILELGRQYHPGCLDKKLMGFGWLLGQRRVSTLPVGLPKTKKRNLYWFCWCRVSGECRCTTWWNSLCSSVKIVFMLHRNLTWCQYSANIHFDQKYIYLLVNSFIVFTVFHWSHNIHGCNLQLKQLVGGGIHAWSGFVFS